MVTDQNTRTAAIIIPIIIGVFLILPPLFLSAQIPEVGEIATGTLNVRQAPRPGARIIQVLDLGTRVAILTHEEGWYRISHGGKEGYVRAREKYIRLLENTEPSPSVDRPTDTRPETDDLTEMAEFKAKAEDIHRRIETSRAEIRTFTEREVETINRLYETDLSLDTTKKRVKALRIESVSLVERIRETEAEVTTLNGKIGTTEEYASKRIVALYKLSWLGRTPILASAESVYDLFRRQKALENILTSDERVLSEFWRNKSRLQILLEKQAVQIRKKHGLATQLDEQAKKLSRQKDARSELLAEIRKQKALEMAAIDALSRAAEALDTKIASLTTAAKAPAMAVRRKTGEEPSQKPFSLLKGLLNMPVKGRVISLFGPYADDEFEVMNFRSGIDIRAERGDPIRAVSGGTVLFASWFKGYGNMIIIDHGEHYYTVYAHIEEVFKSKDDQVEPGEVVATVGDTGSRSGAKLYFEIRYHGKPMDPLLWISKG